jgi:acyl-CoA dehydrogenase
MTDLLAFLLRERPATVVVGDVAEWWARAAAVRARFPAPVEQAVAGGFLADRLGFAFASGYEAAVHALVPSIPPGHVAAFSVTEEAGNHPRSIATRLEPAGDGFVLHGKKRWSTMAPFADVIVVIAKAGDDASGRPVLRAVAVERGAPGLVVTPMSGAPFVPEIPHAELVLDGIRVAPSAVLPGDGYADYTKAFRTVEDLHVNAAVLGYLLSVATRSAFPGAVRERLVSLVVAARAIASLGVARPETHVALAGLLAEMAALVTEAEPHWSLVPDAERERWYRDRVLTQVASKARDQRRARAFEALEEEGEGET